MALIEELEEQGSFLFRYRSYIPIVLLIAGLVVRFSEGLRLGTTNDRLELTAAAIGLIGLVIRCYTIGYAPEFTSGRNTRAGQVAEVLNTDGVYQVVRNPLYLGNYLMWLAPAILTGNFWFAALFTLLFLLYYERIIFAEEAHLRGRFKESYLAWSAKTPLLIPRSFPKSPTDRPFNYRKVLRQEINGLLALAVVFLIFSSIDNSLRLGHLSQPSLANMTATGGVILLFLVVRLLRKKSSYFRVT